MLETNNLVQYNSTNDMVTDVRVLHTLVKHWMLSDLSCGDVVREDGRRYILVGEVNLRVGVPLKWLQLIEKVMVGDDFHSSRP